MRNRVLVLILGVIAIFPVMAQSKPFIGYDKAAWGISEKEVRQLYSFGDDIKTTVYEQEPNIVWIDQENVSNTIKVRRFYFNGGKLYRVRVTYKDGSDATKNSLKNLLEQRYGSQTDIVIQSGDMVASIPYTESVAVFGKFSPEIEVQLIQRNYGYRTGFSPDIEVYYTWKKFRDDYEASKMGL
jgi:hypothetical protein